MSTLLKHLQQSKDCDCAFCKLSDKNCESYCNLKQGSDIQLLQNLCIQASRRGKRDIKKIMKCYIVLYVSYVFSYYRSFFPIVWILVEGIEYSRCQNRILHEKSGPRATPEFRKPEIYKHIFQATSNAVGDAVLE